MDIPRIKRKCDLLKGYNGRGEWSLPVKKLYTLRLQMQHMQTEECPQCAYTVGNDIYLAQAVMYV